MSNRIRAALVLSLIAAPALAADYAPDLNDLDIALTMRRYGDAKVAAEGARTSADAACKQGVKAACIDYRYLSAMVGVANDALGNRDAARTYYSIALQSAYSPELLRALADRNRDGASKLSPDDTKQLLSAVNQLWRQERTTDALEDGQRKADDQMHQANAAAMEAGSQKAKQMYAEERAAKERAAAEKRAAKESEGPGIFGTMMGAVGGAIGAGGKGAAAVQGAIMGAQLAQGGSAAQQVYNQLQAGHPTTMAPMAGAGMPVAGARPNMALQGSACSGFTEQNYRSKALSGGGDAQLYAMCGQAFEYYVAYKRALVSGQDASTTYKAHQDAALNATSFYENNRAN